MAEFCLLRRVIAQIVQENLLAVPDLAQVNETLDEQAQAALEMLSERFGTHPEYPWPR